MPGIDLYARKLGQMPPTAAEFEGTGTAAMEQSMAAR